ncbi:MAG TPA: hypothetical protein PKI05_05060, partial [Thermogutta sp.]|nr:hypothetical protein [Thermogutta sp.]
RVWVRVILQEKPNVLLVPRISVVREETDRWVVWVWNKRRVERRVVTVGIMNDSFAEILSGLAEGEEVVLTPETGGAASH